jgi:hypothetical protein
LIVTTEAAIAEKPARNPRRRGGGHDHGDMEDEDF